MDKFAISENLSSWLRAISGAIGILLLTVFVLWNNEDERISTFTQETQTNEILKSEIFSPDEAEHKKKPEVEIQEIQYRH
jgi:hypothetical protein